MADNVIASAAVGVGATFATDEVGGAHYPYSKIAFGPDGTATIVSASNGLPVSVINTSVAVTDNGGSLTVDGTVAATQSGSWTVSASQSGTWNIANISGTVSLPTGASTAAKQPAIGVAGTASSDVLTIQGIASMTPLQIADNGGSITVDGTVAATQSGTWNVGTVTTLTSVTNPVAVTDNSGSLTVDDGGSSLTVDGTVAATQSGTWNVTNISGTVSLPTGAATAAKQPALGTAGAASADVITVQGIASGVAQPVSQSGSWTVTANAGTGTLTTTNSSIGTGGSAAPTAATQIGAKVSTNMQVLTGTNTAPGFYALHCDVRAFGGTIGQTIASLSMPVAIASDQSVIPTSQDSATLYAGTTALTPKFASIAASSSGDNTIVAAVTSKKIRVIRFSLSASGTVNAKWKSGSGTDLTGLFYMVANGGAGANYTPVGLFETASNTALVLNLSGATAVGGFLTYVEVS